MATFYLLPPRDCLDKAVGELFTKLLPGLPLPDDVWGAVAFHLGRAAGWESDVYLVPRDDLTDGPTAEALADGFGAEPGDRVIEVSTARPARTWVLTATDIPGAVAAR